MKEFGFHSDDEMLASFEQKVQLIRDRVRGVAHRYYTAAYLVGRPGTSKTFTVRQELEQLGIPFVLRNARMSPMGLFDFLHEHPEHVVVLDDIASLFGQGPALQILMAALDGDPGQPRKVTYKTRDKDISFEFSGGIIAISNVPLRNDPLANAVASRVVQLEHEPTDEEIAAFMRQLSLTGYKELSSDQCREVANFVVLETRNYDERLDLRHLTKAYEDRRQWEHGESQTAWQDLVRTSLKKMLTSRATPRSKAEEIDEQRDRVKRAIEAFPDDRKKQMEEADLKKSTFYKRLKEVK
ncbi:ATP-binding protein [Bremerella sp. T1]|uniref:ATP-binding protein n=1 Tax=Bremerella sp. TYQ1 TaxID=3119568 RepID=UPI001CCC725D|nr:ATP-binding protein [Bremerella volcania]UBM35336.1 ATP-binding protein [Bremerella volcania]